MVSSFILGSRSPTTVHICFVRLLHFLSSQTTDYFSCLHCFLLKAFSQHFPNLTMQGSYYYMLKIHICIFDSTYYSTSQILVASYPGSRPTKTLGIRLKQLILFTNLTSPNDIILIPQWYNFPYGSLLTHQPSHPQTRAASSWLPSLASRQSQTSPGTPPHSLQPVADQMTRKKTTTWRIYTSCNRSYWRRRKTTF